MVSILTYPDPVLRETADPVTEIDENIRELADQMLDIMYQDDGVGLAANQIGVPRQLIVLDDGEGPRILINPEIVNQSEDQEAMEEGCLSLPGIRLDVRRPVQVSVRAMDENGNPVSLDAEGWLARILQHEIDHLRGKLIIDHASAIQRTLLKSKLKKLQQSV